MDDSRLANLLFLAGLASLALPGCGGDGEPGVGPGDGAPGNPLASSNSLGGGDARDACVSFFSKLTECAGPNDDDYDYNSSGYYGVSVAGGYADDCDEYIEGFKSYGGPGCLSAAVDYFSCLSALSCQALGADETACNGALAAAETKCNLGGGGGIEDDGE
jgi:hypothetical protein